MDSERKTKRVFFAMESHAPWPEMLSNGKIISETHRHMTLGFLGNVDIEQLMEKLEQFPKPYFDLGFTGILDKCLFFPEKHPKVVAWKVNVQKRQNELKSFHISLTNWLKQNNYPTDERDYLPHITICRGRFNPREWRDSFTPLPVMLTHIHLYESLGQSEYRSLWENPLTAPFEEMEHTADIAFRVRGRSTIEIYEHALTALAFGFPEILKFRDKNQMPASLDEIIIALNDVIAIADTEIGAPYKAVSYHGKLAEKYQCLEWEMIVDV